MNRIVITDSTSDITLQEAERYGVEVVPLGILFEDGSSYLEGVDITLEQYFTKLETCKAIPKTSQPSPERYLEIITRAKAAGKDVLIITISTGLSGTYQAACVARDTSGYDRVFVIDSYTCISGMRFLVEEAIRHDADMTTEALVAHLEEMKTRIKLFAGVDRLEFLQKSGRLPKVVELIGKLIRLKLIVTMGKDGRAELLSKKFGMRAIVSSIASKFEEYPRDENYPVHVDYVMTQINSDMLKEALEERIPGIETRTYPAGGVIGTHIGVNACALVYVARSCDPVKKDLE